MSHPSWWKALADCRTVVELGCGFGVVLKELTEHGFEAHGVDIFPEYLKYVPVVAPAATCECADALSWCTGQEDRSWDAVLLVDFLEHVPYPIGEAILAECQRIARRTVIVEGPAGFVEQAAEEAVHIGTPGVPDMLNPYQEHVSGWDLGDLAEFGFSGFDVPGNLGYPRMQATWTR